MKSRVILFFLYAFISLAACNDKNGNGPEDPSPIDTTKTDIGKSKLEYKVQIVNDLNKQSVDSFVVEIYKTMENRAVGEKVLISKKTNSEGIVVFKATDFNPENKISYKDLKGVYYLNIYKRSLRSQVASKPLNFLTDNEINQQVYLEDVTASQITVKVAIVYENFIIPQTGKTIHSSFNWMNPKKLAYSYQEAMEEAAGGVVKYEISEEINADTTFTYYKNDDNKTPLSKFEIGRRLSDRGGWKDFEASVRYNYNKMISYYGFDAKRDNEEVHEVWVVTQPFSGMYESHMMGEGAFWCNSPPAENPTCKKLLTVMFFNYERSPAEAVHSFGHRFESVMMEVYGWWDYKNKPEISQLTNFELFTTHQLEYQKYDNSCKSGGNCYAHTGVCHYPPNGQSDYDYSNKREVYSYANCWLNYPYVREDPDLLQKVSCNTWDCEQLKYLKWWYSFIPRYKGINAKDRKLNNWWLYLVNYNEAKKREVIP
ncbi:hypothetical protein MASR2M117_22210 [Paludibacter sp.]